MAKRLGNYLKKSPLDVRRNYILDKIFSENSGLKIRSNGSNKCKFLSLVNYSF